MQGGQVESLWRSSGGGKRRGKAAEKAGYSEV